MHTLIAAAYYATIAVLGIWATIFIAVVLAYLGVRINDWLDKYDQFKKYWESD